MELEFEHAVLMDHAVVAEVTLCQEETLESIVPDACPDILRIVDVYGQAMLTTKQAGDGYAVVSGTVRTVIIYEPEEGAKLRRMEAALPFTCQANAPGLTTQGIVIASPKLRGAEARALNPRKVLLRVDLAVEIVACQPNAHKISSGVTRNEAASLCQKQCNTEHYQLLCVQEKPFTFVDQIRRIPGQVLAMRAEPVCSESKLIGNKLVFKGTIELYLLQQQADQSLCQTHETLPFSQIMEVPEVGESCDCHVRVDVVNVQSSAAEEESNLEVCLELLAQVDVWSRTSVTILEDLYSTGWTMEMEPVIQPLTRFVEQSVQTQSVRELIETESLVRSVIDHRVTLGQIVQKKEGHERLLETEAWISVLYLNEEDTLQCVKRMLPVVCRLPNSGDRMYRCQCNLMGEVYTSPTAGGIEIRFGVDFQYTITESLSMQMVDTARLIAPRGTEGEGRPSIVLRMVGETENLWEIAKSYGTTMQQIMQANELTEESCPNGKMLLIPSLR